MDINPTRLVYLARVKATGQEGLVGAIHFGKKEVLLINPDYDWESGQRPTALAGFKFDEVVLVGIALRNPADMPEPQPEPLAIITPPGFRHD